MISEQVLNELRRHANSDDATFLQRFFKTGKGEYGEGDVFIGVRMPVIRVVAKHFEDVNLKDLKQILASPVHEMRMCAAVIMSERAKRADVKQLKELAEFYLSQTSRLNNWDIVDISCSNVVGQYLLNSPDNLHIVYKLARSPNVWERRIAIISTGQFIKTSQFEPTLRVAKMLLNDNHDLIHKAVGWMLREVGKSDLAILKSFLKENYANLPRTTLRYSIERFDVKERRRFLDGKP